MKVIKLPVSKQENDPFAEFLNSKTNTKEIGVSEFVKTYGKLPVLASDDYTENFIAKQEKDIAIIPKNSSLKDLLGDIPNVTEMFKPEIEQFGDDYFVNDFQTNYKILSQNTSKLPQSMTKADDYDMFSDVWLSKEPEMIIRPIEQSEVRDVVQNNSSFMQPYQGLQQRYQTRVLDDYYATTRYPKLEERIGYYRRDISGYNGLSQRYYRR